MSNMVDHSWEIWHHMKNLNRIYYMSDSQSVGYRPLMDTADELYKIFHNKQNTFNFTLCDSVWN